MRQKQMERWGEMTTLLTFSLLLKGMADRTPSFSRPWERGRFLQSPHQEGTMRLFVKELCFLHWSVFSLPVHFPLSLEPLPCFSCALEIIASFLIPSLLDRLSLVSSTYQVEGKTKTVSNVYIYMWYRNILNNQVASFVQYDFNKHMFFF